ncbi:MAG TPA: hypothetical protein PKW46_10015, partial [Thermotogota bacterium]|nr:hypothetical protein [Thermotogota bacterium]
MRKRYSREKQETRMGLLFLLPSLIVIVLITFLPIGQTFYRSLFRWDIKFESRQYFTGLTNYTAIFQGLVNPDEALSWAPAPNTNSMAVLVRHSLSALPFFFACSAGRVGS